MLFQKTFRWATIAAFSAALLPTSTALSRAEDAVILECRQAGASADAAVTYQVLREGNTHLLVKNQGGREAARTELSSFGSVTGYGGTYLFYENHGRSGYLLLYFHKGGGAQGDKSLIDVNLFQPHVSPLNSGGPQLDFRCRLL